MLEIALGTGFGAIGPDARLRDIEIDLHDTPLPPDLLDQESEPCLHPLAEIAAALPQEDVLRGLLGNRRAAPDAAALRVACRRLGNRLGIETVMLAEFPVLGRDYCIDEVAIDIGKRFPILRDGILVHHHRRRDRHRHPFEQQDQRQADSHEPEDQLDEKEGCGADHGPGLAAHRAKENPPERSAREDRSDHRISCQATPGSSLSPAIRCIAFCSFSKARTSIWRIRSRLTS